MIELHTREIDGQLQAIEAALARLTIQLYCLGSFCPTENAQRVYIRQIWLNGEKATAAVLAEALGFEMRLPQEDAR